MDTSDKSSVLASSNEVGKALKDALSKAIPLQVHRKTNSPTMKNQLAEILTELVQLRETNQEQLRMEDEVKKHLDAIILDLWMAAKCHESESPWRRISLNRNDYSKTRDIARNSLPMICLMAYWKILFR